MPITKKSLRKIALVAFVPFLSATSAFASDTVTIACPTHADQHTVEYQNTVPVGYKIASITVDGHKWTVIDSIPSRGSKPTPELDPYSVSLSDRGEIKCTYGDVSAHVLTIYVSAYQEYAEYRFPAIKGDQNCGGFSPSLSPCVVRGFPK